MELTSACLGRFSGVSRTWHNNVVIVVVVYIAIVKTNYTEKERNIQEAAISPGRSLAFRSHWSLIESLN